MSGLVAVLGAVGDAQDESEARALLERSRSRGSERSGFWTENGNSLGVCRDNWELGADFAGGVLVLDQDHLVVAADASLYYRDDLRHGLGGAGVELRGDSASHLIAAAYQAWGSALLDRLEGDFAFVLWDRRRRQLLAGRDLAGSRPLFFARAGARLVLGSSLTGVAGFPGVSRQLNRLALAEDLIGSVSMAVGETAFAGVERVPPGARLQWQPGSAPRVEQFWRPPLFDQGENGRPADVVEQLLAVMGEAVKQRLAGDGVTGVWMSGGYDSPAVFALAQASRPRNHPNGVVPVSMSYPPGDPGREDELIQAAAAHWQSQVHWVLIDQVPSLPGVEQWAQQRDEPFAHPYEEWNKALAKGSREVGARVILGGNGGDQFFGVSPVFLADLLRSGRVASLVSEAKAIGFGYRSYRDLFHWAIQPALPSPLLNVARRLRGGRRLKAHLQDAIPDWLGFDQRTMEALWDRQWHYGLRRNGETLASAETSWYLQSAFGPRVGSFVSGFAHQMGVEARSPLFDRRVIEFMARRPREDRFAQGETKRLLRRALAGLLPAEHLARRTTRTGQPSAYLNRVRLEALPGWLEAAGLSLRLTDLGLADMDEVRRAMARFLANPKWEGALGRQLFNLLSAEFWVRVHSEEPAPAEALVA